MINLFKKLCEFKIFSNLIGKKKLNRKRDEVWQR